MKRKLTFEGEAFDNFVNWVKLDKKLHGKIVTLIQDIDRSPFSGLGKPEPLKYDLSGSWSRRINDEHRLVYKVTDSEIVIISCRYHYE
jgi:toxin YoeB